MSGASRPNPNLGRRIKHYQINRALGEGGIGQVYQAEHLNDNKRPVALKLLRNELSRNAELRTRFLQEAQISAQIAHPNIVEIIDYGETMDGECFLVMELLEGLSLGEAMKQLGGPMTSQRVGHIGLQICAALHAAHQRGAVHRDLKPDNIFLLDKGGQKDFVKVLDFGLAKVLQGDPQHALTTIGKVLGTPYFMSPEQALGDPVDGRTDVYALGIVLYQMATDTLPFTGKTVGEVMYKQVHQAAPAPKSRHSKIESALSKVLLECLQKEKEKRYPSMLRLAKELGTACKIDTSAYLSNDKIPKIPEPTPPPEPSTNLPSWSFGVPPPPELQALRDGKRVMEKMGRPEVAFQPPALGQSAAGLPSESQIETVHIRPKQKNAWLIPVSILVFFATIGLLVFLSSLAR